MDQEQLRLMEMEDEDEARAKAAPTSTHKATVDLSPISEADRTAVDLAIGKQKQAPLPKFLDAAKYNIDDANENYVEPAARGAQQGVSLRFSDELKGAGAVKDKVDEAVHNPFRSWKDIQDRLTHPIDSVGKDLSELNDTYVTARNKDQEANKAAEKKSPYVYSGSELLGSLATPVPGLGGAKTLGALAVAGAKAGAPLAVTNYLGGTEIPWESIGRVLTPGMAAGDDDLSFTDSKKSIDDKDNAKVGKLALGTTAAGLGGGLTSGAAGMVTGKVGQWLSDKAERAAVDSISAGGAISDKLRKEGLETPSQVRQFGRNLLKENIVPWSGSKEEAFNRTEALKDQVGKPIGEYMERLDNETVPERYRRTRDQVAEGATPTNGMNYTYLAHDAENALPKKNAVLMNAADKGQELVDLFRKQGELTPGSFKGAWDAKSAAQNGLNFSNTANASQEIAKDVEREGRKSIMAQALAQDKLNRWAPKIQQLDDGTAPMGKIDRFDGSIGDEVPMVDLTKETQEAQSAADKFKDNLKRYGYASTANDILRNSVSREGQRSALGLAETGAAMTGLASGNPLGAAAGIAGAVGLHALKQRGYGPAARAADLMSKQVPSLAQRATDAAGYEMNHRDDSGLTAWERFLRDDEGKK